MTVHAAVRDAWTRAELADPGALSARMGERGVSLTADEVALLT